MEGIQVGWKVGMLRKRGNQDLTTCRLRARDCAGLSNCQSPSYASISRDIDAFLRFRVSTGSGDFSFPWSYSTKASYPGVLKEGIRIEGISCIEDLS